MIQPADPGGRSIPIDPEQQPCIYKCKEEHEAVHQAGCEGLGAQKYGALTEPQKEIPAYRKEIACYKRLLGSIN